MSNLAASIRARLLNYARQSETPFNAVLEQYATNRFLWRLSQSEYRERFILKGAQLFRIWSEEIHRPTRDVDFLGFGDPSEEALKKCFEQICQVPAIPEDGLILGSVATSPIRDDMDYGGIRVTMKTLLDGARIPLQVDVGFGDAITPAPIESRCASLLNFPPAELLVYPPETVIAEKLEAAITLGIANSRMKDFFDLHWLSLNMEFEYDLLSSAVKATFERRGTDLPIKTPLALTSDFSGDPQKNTQWNAFIRKGKLSSDSLSDVILHLHEFLNPLIQSSKEYSGNKWKPTRGWTTGE